LEESGTWEAELLGNWNDRSTFAPARLNQPNYEVGALATRPKEPSSRSVFALKSDSLLKTLDLRKWHRMC
jgi:hypothetical protein